ncbi:hypothetical protein [Fictibacillus enclensis]|uniref:hypothetical protein n=1 Tax=Fictibacillus enclensis TaxID=1017270 RepID=UPI0025A2E192|nr:hypothetical protein [Fictibacillus enclensis]
MSQRNEYAAIQDSEVYRDTEENIEQSFGISNEQMSIFWMLSSGTKNAGLVD